MARLPVDGGPRWNRLVFEKSPYLLQHAGNPVDWYPWGEEALAAAREQRKPIFLSVGYATCHWCHVMEHECFEDPEVADYLNRHFIAIKVDREERPDIDQVYMNVTQALTGSGGWPMTVVLTPEQKPFFAGTYFPKHGRGQRPGLMELLPSLVGAWTERREEVASSADRIVAALREQERVAGGTGLADSTLTSAFRALEARYDSVHGGFGSAPKFPVPHQLRFLLRYHDRTSDPHALAMVAQTLRSMRSGGIYDQVGHGFHRYSTDRSWLLPHFEKMLYDQALLASAYTEAWLVTHSDEFRSTAVEILEFVLREMTSPEGGFYSAFDADSEGEEGKFYLWTPEELRSVLGPEDASLYGELFGVVEGGNFRDQATGEPTGASILHRREAVEGTAGETGGPPAAWSVRLEACRRKLYARRARRVPPLLDDKVLTDWNGLMISAFAAAGQAFDEPRFTAAATRATDFIRNRMTDEEGRLYKRYRDGQAAHAATLDDYAFLICGLLDLYESTFETRHLEWAVGLERQMQTHFADPAGGGFHLSADDGERLFLRAKEVYDGAVPSGNSAAVSALARLARFTGDLRYEERAVGVCDAFSARVSGSPSVHTHLLLGLDFLLGPTSEVGIVGHRETSEVGRLLRTLRTSFIPRKVVHLQEPGETRLAVLAPYAALPSIPGQPGVAYVCRDFVCQLPTEDPESMMRTLTAGR